ncbi:MAG: M23 family metallopeptidase [Candidatus Nanosyncoccaceae bacterium]|jgi:hypothetical protein
MNQPKRLTIADVQASERLRRQALRSSSDKSKPDNQEEVIFQYYQKTTTKLDKKTRKKRSLLKIGPLLLLVALIYIGLSIVSYLNPPLSALARLASDTFNTQDVAVDARLIQLLDYKLNSDPGAPVKYQILADYRTITPELTERLKKQKIELNQEDHTVIYDEKEIYGDQFIANLNNDLDFIQAIDVATAIRRTMFHDEVWQGYKEETKLNQSGIWIEHPKADMRQQELEITRANTSGFRFEVGDDSSGQLSSITENLKKLNETANELNKIKNTPNGKSFTNLIFVDKPNETCSLYQTARAVQNYQKTAQSTQLSKLASLLLSEADKIKAGEADSEVVNYINDRLTQSGFYIDGSGQKQIQKSAMDSYAQHYLSSGISGPLDGSAQKYVIGANEPLSRTLTVLKNQGESDNCSNSSGFSFKNIFLSIWRFLTGQRPSDEATRHLTDEVKLNTTSTSLSAMTGLATAPDLSGEDLANGFASGVAELMNNNAKNSGLAVLTKNQAVAYLTAQQDLIARRAEIDRRTLSPFDTSSPYTFLGSITTRFGSLLGQNNLVSKISAFTIVAKQSVLTNSRPVYASTEQISQSLSQCYDPEYLEVNPDIALGVYCDIKYGAPVEILDTKIEPVINQLVDTGNLKIVDGSCDANGNFCQLESAGDLKDYEDNCFHRETDIGISGENNSKGENCIVTEGVNKLFPIYLLDQRVDDGLKRRKLDDNKLATDNWPVPSSRIISSFFGWRRGGGIVPTGMHNGIDIPAKEGAPVVASHDGSVTFVGKDSSGGLGIKIKTDDGKVETHYWHLSKASIQMGQRVKLGQQIGEIGSTGVSTGPHLHFEYHLDGKPVDPMLFLNRFPNHNKSREDGDGHVNVRPTNRTGSGIVNISDYILTKTKNNVSDFARSVQNKNITQTAKKEYSDLCLSFSYYHAYQLYNGDPNSMTPNAAAIYSYANQFKRVRDSDKSTVLGAIYDSINHGKPAVLQVNGDKAGTRRHFVTVVGYKNHVSSAHQLDEQDLLILDSWDGKLETMDAAKSRFMFADKEARYQTFVLR